MLLESMICVCVRAKNTHFKSEPEERGKKEKSEVGKKRKGDKGGRERERDIYIYI